VVALRCSATSYLTQADFPLYRKIVYWTECDKGM
jgi:hypothetical protein